MTGARRILSWTLLGVVLIGPLGFGLARLSQAATHAALTRETAELAAEVARARAARLPALEAELAAQTRGPAAPRIGWRGETPDRAALDMLETVRRLAGGSGLVVDRIALVPHSAQTPDRARIALTLSARGSLEALQVVLYRIETARPRITVTALRLAPGSAVGNAVGNAVGQVSGGASATDLALTLSLAGVFDGAR